MATLIVEEFDHGSTSELEYTLEWTHWLDADNGVNGVDGIATSEWTCSDPAIEISGGDNDLPAASAFAIVALGKTRWYATVWVGPIPEGTVVTLTNRVTTTLGRVEERSIQLTGVDR